MITTVGISITTMTPHHNILHNQHQHHYHYQHLQANKQAQELQRRHRAMLGQVAEAEDKALSLEKRNETLVRV